MLDTISSPTLILDEKRCRENIKAMAEKATANGLEFRPHFKTHQSADISRWFREYDTQAITVSSIKMAEYFADDGWTDITIAFPVNIRALDRINALSKKVEHLTVLVNASTPIEYINHDLQHSLQVKIEIDTGSRRTGVDPADQDTIKALVVRLSAQTQLEFTGFYSHPGHSYSARSQNEIGNIHRNVLGIMKDLRNRYENASSRFTICIGDTPCCSVADEFDPIDAISPGNFVFYDLMQAQIGSCNINQIAVTLACPIVDIYPKRNELVVHGGAVHLSKDKLKNGNASSSNFGVPVKITSDGWSDPLPDSYVRSLSQEHGIIHMPSSRIKDFQVGDLIGILPVHSCLTADLMASYVTLENKYLNHMKSC